MLFDSKDAITPSALGTWYQASIDSTVPPIWTDAHLEELMKDFYLFPKDNRQEETKKEKISPITPGFDPYDAYVK